MPTNNNTTTCIEVPFWPSAVNNLKWSADNLIAVGGGESLAILVPRLGTKGPNNLPWDSIQHRVSYFNYHEIPILEALSSASWSLGEELSVRHVTELEWSSPGLGKFSTCLLAVLHSNHVLGLWECIGRPEIKDDWRRCTIVNHAVQKYYANLDSGEPQAEDGESRTKHEKERVRQRITAFTWSPPLRKHEEPLSQGLDQHLTYGCHYLAVSTEAGDVMLLNVQTPYDLLEGPWQERNLTVLNRFPIALPAPVAPNGDTNASQDRIATGKRPTASHIAWSDWTSGHDKQEPAHDSRLAIIAGGRLFSCRVLATHLDDGQAQFQCSAWDEFLLPQAPGLRGPLRFIAATSTVVLFADDAVLQADIVLGWHQSHHLDGRWDEPSASSVTICEDGRSDLHIASHLSSSAAETSRLPLDWEERNGTNGPDWQHAIQESKANFSVSHDLAGNVQERTWGIAASPLEDLVAVCVSHLPSDSPAHIIQSHQKSDILITSEWKSAQTPWSDRGLQATPESISAETLLYSLRQFIARNGPFEDVAEWKRAQFDTILRTMGLDERDHGQDSFIVASRIIAFISTVDITHNGLELCVRYLRARVYYDTILLQDRLTRLIAIAVQESPKLQLPREAYDAYLEIFLSLPTKLISAGGALSKRIAAAMKLVSSKVVVQSVTDESVEFSEQCSVCAQPIQLESLRWSRCAGGHQFPRCSLTFLSILQPGMSKSCRICGAQSLNEYALPEMSTLAAAHEASEADGFTVEPQASFARVFFAACDKCIFCGGKFVA